MAFTEADRVQIRKYLGAAGIFLQAWPRLENAITAVQSVADGGTRPDNSTEVDVKAIVAKLQEVDCQLDQLDSVYMAATVDELKVDPFRAQIALRTRGRMLVTRLATHFDTRPLRDVFSSTPPNPSGEVGAFMGGYEP